MKNMMKLLAAMLALLLCVPAFGLCEEAEEIPTIVNIVRAPEQTKAERPSCFPDPTENYIPLPETENFADFGSFVVADQCGLQRNTFRRIN